MDSGSTGEGAGCEQSCLQPHPKKYQHANAHSVHTLYEMSGLCLDSTFTALPTTPSVNCFVSCVVLN